VKPDCAPVPFPSPCEQPSMVRTPRHRLRNRALIWSRAPNADAQTISQGCAKVVDIGTRPDAETGYGVIGCRSSLSVAAL
jgi:hypothetical protein